MKERNKKIARQIADLELKAAQKDNTYEKLQSIDLQISKLIAGLSINDILEIDNYIQEENLLTK
jgi:hypothetical protein